MPKLIIDQQARNLILDRLPGQPIYAQPDGSILDPGVIDLVDDTAPTGAWNPANAIARGVVLGVEACKEIVFQAERFKERSRQGRTLKAMTVPVCSLMDVLKMLLGAFNTPDWCEERKKWPPHDQEFYRSAGRRLKKDHMSGPVRKIRHKIGAHLDFDAAQGGNQISADQLLHAMADSLMMLLQMLNHPSSCSWIRAVATLDNGEGYVVDLMEQYPICLRWVTDINGHAKDVGYLQLAANPLNDLKLPIEEAIGSHNMMVMESKCSRPMIKVVTTSGPGISVPAPLRRY